jgi:hypothetical protein
MEENSDFHEAIIRLDEVDKRLASTDKRIDDIKWLVGGTAGIFTVVFSVLMVALSWNYSNERASLRDFERDIKADLGKLDEPAELELLGANGLPLAGQEVPASIEKEQDQANYLVIFRSILRNKGLGPSGPIYMKLYTKKPLTLASSSTDEPNFQYEIYFSPKDMEPSDLPGQFSSDRIGRIAIEGGLRPAAGKYLIMIKTYYGRGKVAQAAFTIAVQ